MQDIPPAFTEKTGWPRKPDCTLVMSSNAQKEWPILFSIVQASGGARTASSVGHGWTSFLQDQEVAQGSLLIFEFVDATSLAVTIYHPDRPRKIEDVGGEQSNRRKAHGPVFQKTLKASHVRQGHASRLVSLPITQCYIQVFFIICFGSLILIRRSSMKLLILWYYNLGFFHRTFQ